MRTCKKEYYNKILDRNKTNMKGLWNVLNSIIRNGAKNKNTGYQEFYIEKDKTINNMEDVVNGFNKFFVNVGPDLADKIQDPEATDGVVADLWDRNPNFIFLRAVEEKQNSGHCRKM